MHRRPALTAVTLTAAILAACGGGGSDPAEKAAPEAPAIAPTPAAVLGTSQTAPAAPPAPAQAAPAPAVVPTPQPTPASPPAASAPAPALAPAPILLERSGSGELVCTIRQQDRGPLVEWRSSAAVVFAFPRAALAQAAPALPPAATAVSVEPVSGYASEARVRDDGRSYYLSTSPAGRSEVVLEPGGRVVSVYTYGAGGVSSFEMECR